MVVPLEIILLDGDLIVNVGKDLSAIECQFQVASQILWNASSSFRASFGPKSQFASAVKLRAGQLREIEMDDDAEAMGLVLRILELCLKHKTLPQAVELDVLANIAIIADKYELEDAVGPAVKVWAVEHDGLQDEYDDVGCREWLLITWVFRFEEWFTEVTNTASFSRKHFLDAFDDLPQLAVLVGNELGDRITELRQLRINGVREHFASIQRQRRGGLLDPDKWTCKVPTRECHFMQLGHLVNTVDLFALNKDITWEDICMHTFVTQLDALQDVTMDPSLHLLTQKNYCEGCGSPLASLRKLVCDSCSFGQDFTASVSHDNCGWLETARTCAWQTTGLKLAEFPSRA